MRCGMTAFASGAEARAPTSIMVRYAFTSMSAIVP